MIRWGLIVVLTVGVLVVANENRTDPITLQMFLGFRTPPVSIATLVLLSFAAGAAVVALWVVPAWIRASLKARRQRKEIESLEGQMVTQNTSSQPAAAPPTLPPHDIA